MPGKLYSITETRNFVVGLGLLGYTPYEMFLGSNPLTLKGNGPHEPNKNPFVALDFSRDDGAMFDNYKIPLLYIDHGVFMIAIWMRGDIVPKILHKFLLGKQFVYFHDTLIKDLCLVAYS